MGFHRLTNVLQCHLLLTSKSKEQIIFQDWDINKTTIMEIALNVKEQMFCLVFQR